MSKSETWKMARAEITPERMRYAKEKFRQLGIHVVYEDDLEIRVLRNAEVIRFHPFTGAYIGKGVKPGRGLSNLLALFGSKTRLVDSK